MVGFALFIVLLCCFIMVITALVNTEIIPSVLFGIFAGALSVVLSMIIFLRPISKESVHVVISSKVGVLEIDNTQYHIKDVFRASEDSTIVKYVCDDEFPAQDLKFTKTN